MSRIIGAILDLSETTEYYLVRGMQLALAVMGGYGLFTARVGVIIPAAVALAITSLPALLRREYSYSMDMRLVLWITLSVFLHAVGSLGLYGRYQWYDEITHTVSATMIAALGYASFRALELHTDELEVPKAFRAVFIVVFVLAAAVMWEIMEFAFSGYFTVFGIDDIVTDMIANTVGAVIVAIWGAGSVDGLIGFFRNRLRSTDDQEG